MSSSGEFLSFAELTTDIEFIQVDPIFGFTSIGEGARFEAELYAPGTDVRNAEPDEVLGTKTGELRAIAQLGNGEFIAEITETIQLPSGEIFTQGLFNVRELETSQPQIIPIAGGTGDFDSFNDLRGVETITQPSLFVFDIVDITLQEFERIRGSDNSDIINGMNYSEIIAGNNGDDTIAGGQGNDILEGGRGGDIISGGAGDDTLAADRIDSFEDFDGSQSELRGDNGDDIIYGGSKDDSIDGGNDDDLLFGNSGNDLIRGGNGLDLLQGGVGNDTLRGQGGIDVVNYSDLTFDGVFGSVAGVNVNLQTNQAKHSSNNNALTWTDTLTTIENVIGTSRNDRFVGDNGDNVLNGLAEVGRDDRQTEFVGLNGESYQVTGDVVEYDGNKADFTLGESQQPFVGGLTVTGEGIGTDILLDIEFIKFNDGLVATDSINNTQTNPR